MPLLFFFFGLFWGSFLNNIAFRLVKNENFLFNRSKCPYCGKILKLKELIPILSFILQKGKCLNCQKKISLRYPLTELITGFFVFYLSLIFLPWKSFPNFIEFIFYFILLSVLFILALYDLDTYLVETSFLIFLLIVGIIFNLYHYFLKIPIRDFSYLFNYFFFFNLPETIISSLILTSIFLLIFLITKGKGLGFGDVETVFVMGLFFKPGDALLILIFSSFFGSLYGFYLFLKNKNLKTPIPFIPFFFIGILATFILGEIITKIYFNLFLPF
ncbi:MAG: hypothetical protein C4278_00255 [Patescibacteria group bacterium]